MKFENIHCTAEVFVFSIIYVGMYRHLGAHAPKTTRLTRAHGRENICACAAPLLRVEGYEEENKFATLACEGVGAGKVRP